MTNLPKPNALTSTPLHKAGLGCLRGPDGQGAGTARSEKKVFNKRWSIRGCTAFRMAYGFKRFNHLPSFPASAAGVKSQPSPSLLPRKSTRGFLSITSGSEKFPKDFIFATSELNSVTYSKKKIAKMGLFRVFSAAITYSQTAS